MGGQGFGQGLGMIGDVQNFQNLIAQTTGLGHNRYKTHCLRGHPFDEANTYRYKNNRNCRECRRIANREYRARGARARRLLSLARQAEDKLREQWQ